MEAIGLRKEGYSIKHIASQLNVAVSSVSMWVRAVPITIEQQERLNNNSHSTLAVEKRRLSRLSNELIKRSEIINVASNEITDISMRELWLMGVMLYWAKGGKTQRMVRFSNGDPDMHVLMMKFFRQVCKVPENKFRGYIHIHDHLDFEGAEIYWSNLINIPSDKFFKTHGKVSSKPGTGKNTLPHGVLDIYVLDAILFLKISGWARGIFLQHKYDF